MNIRKIKFVVLIFVSTVTLLPFRDLQSAGLDLFDDKATEKSMMGQATLENVVDKSLEKNRLEKLYNENAEMIEKCHCTFSICLKASHVISNNDPEYQLKIEKQEAEEAAAEEYRDNLGSVCRKWKIKYEEAKNSGSSVNAASFLDDFYERDTQIKNKLQSKINKIEALHDRLKEQVSANYRKWQAEQAALKAQREVEERRGKEKVRRMEPRCHGPGCSITQ